MVNEEPGSFTINNNLNRNYKAVPLITRPHSAQVGPAAEKPLPLKGGDQWVSVSIKGINNKQTFSLA